MKNTRSDFYLTKTELKTKDDQKQLLFLEGYSDIDPEQEVEDVNTIMLEDETGRIIN